MSRTAVPAVTLPPLLQAVLRWRDSIGQLRRWSRRHGDLFTLCLPSTGEVVAVRGPSPAHDIHTRVPALSRTGYASGCVRAAVRQRWLRRRSGADQLLATRAQPPALSWALDCWRAN